ncbi:hypothetical protein [Sutcliffiella horikoshii]|nr:hypothetical protein [Sutcliffiella horikoshii]
MGVVNLKEKKVVQLFKSIKIKSTEEKIKQYEKFIQDYKDCHKK